MSVDFTDSEMWWQIGAAALAFAGVSFVLWLTRKKS